MSILKSIAFIASLAPLAWMAARLFLLGGCANPIQECLHRSGEWALILLLLSLTVTPLRTITGIQQIRPLRRMFGLFSFFYASLHIATYIGIEHFFDWSSIYQDIIRHKRIIIGLASYLILLVLALTSFKYIIKKMGAKKWSRLHKLSYLAAITAVLHYLWLVKADKFKPLLYGTILLTLLGYRVVYHWFTTRSSKPPSNNQYSS